MDIQLEAPVVSSDGISRGKISKVIFDPKTGETKDLVIHHGNIFGRDVAVPTDCVRVAAPSRVEITWSEAEFEGAPDFVADEYIWPPENWVAPYGWPAGSVMWPEGYMMAAPMDDAAYQISDEAQALLQQRDANNAIVGAGAEVVASTGEKVGSVSNLVIDPVSHRPSRMVVKRGLLFTQDVELPGEWIASYDDNQVMLNVGKDAVEEAAKHNP